MKRELLLYDVYPKVFLVYELSRITIASTDYSTHFKEGVPYKVVIVPMGKGLYHGSKPFDQIEVCEKDQKLMFEYAFGEEQEYYLRILDEEGNRVVQLSVYAVKQDLYERRPYRGDLHVHSCCSDGRESPEFVCGMYRQTGFDFLAITDHYQYEPSLRAIEAYKDVPLGLTILPGEEVHAPNNVVHIVHFGGEWSVNALWREHKEKYFEEVAAIEKTLTCPEGVDSFTYASCLWVYSKIKEAKGLSIFAHPYWVENAYNVPIAFTKYHLEQKPFDAFELLGGQTTHENNMQWAFYNEMRAKGLDTIPVVGSSDSHSTLINDWFNEAKTIVFAKANAKEALFEAIRNQYSVAVESRYGESERIHGNYRLTSYARFLLSEYFPLHDALCYEEGRAMLGYLRQEADAHALLKLTQKRTQSLLDKYFA